MANRNISNGGLVCGTVFVLAGIVLATVSIATDEWVEQAGGHEGLWRSCPAGSSCSTIDGNDSDRDAVRSTMIIGDIFGGICLAFSITLLACLALREINGRWFTPIVALLCFLAFVFTLVGVCVYDGEIYDDIDDALADVDHGYSFWLGVVAVILFGIATIFYVIAIIVSELSYSKRKRREEKQKMVEREKHYVQPYYNGGMVPYVPAKQPVVFDRYYEDRRPHDRRPRAVDYPVPAVPVYPLYRDYYSQDSLNIYNHGEPAVINPSAGRYYLERPKIHKTRGYWGSSAVNGGYQSSRRGRERDPYGYPLNYLRDA